MLSNYFILGVFWFVFSARCYADDEGGVEVVVFLNDVPKRVEFQSLAAKKNDFVKVILSKIISGKKIQVSEFGMQNDANQSDFGFSVFLKNEDSEKEWEEPLIAKGFGKYVISFEFFGSEGEDKKAYNYKEVSFDYQEKTGLEYVKFSVNLQDGKAKGAVREK